MDKNGVIEFRCKKCGRHFWDYLIQNDDDLVVVQAVLSIEEIHRGLFDKPQQERCI